MLLTRHLKNSSSLNLGQQFPLCGMIFYKVLFCISLEHAFISRHVLFLWWTKFAYQADDPILIDARSINLAQLLDSITVHR